MYLISISAEKVRKTLFLHSDNEPLSFQEIAKLSSNSNFLNFAKEKAPKSLLHRADLNPFLVTDPTTAKKCSIAFQQIKPPPLRRSVVHYHTYWFYLKQHCVWLILAPLVALYSFLKQKNPIMGGWNDYLHRLHVDDFNHFLGALEDFQQTIGPSVFQDHLNQAVERGKSIQQALEKEDFSQLETVANTIAKAPPGVYSIPLGIRSKSGFCPLFVVCQKREDGSVRLEINTWGDTQLAPLAQCYEIPSKLAKEGLKLGLQGLMTCLSSSTKKQEMPLTLKEKIRLHNLSHFQFLEDLTTPSLEKESSFEALAHERLLLAGFQPVEEKNLKKREKPDHLTSFIDRSLMSPHFSEVPPPAKLLLFISLFHEGIALFKEAISYLPKDQRKEGLALLEQEFLKINLHAGKYLQTAEEKEAFKGSLAQILKEFEQLKLDLESMESGSNPKSFSVSQTQVIHLTSTPKKSEPLAKEKMKSEGQIEALNFSAIGSSETFKDQITELSKCNQKIDQLVAQKKYAESRSLAFELMKKLPTPCVGQKEIWSYCTPEIADALSEQCELTAKLFWESSLRLKVKTIEPPALLQMIKIQALIVKSIRCNPSVDWNDWTLDHSEIKKLLFLHPHYRWGLHPQEEQEWLPLIQYLYSNEIQNKKIARLDGQIGHYSGHFLGGNFLSTTESRFQIIRRTGKVQELPNQLIDFRRVQMMMTMLTKPDECLFKHYGTGDLQQINGLSYLDKIQQQAKKESLTLSGYKKKLIEIKIRDLGIEMDSMSRFEFKADDFVSESGPILKIINAGTLPGSGVAYLPNGLGLPSDLSKKYVAEETEDNSRDLAGHPLSEKEFAGVADNTSLFTPHPLSLKKGLSKLTEETELTHLSANLQKVPQEHLSQVQRHLVSTLKVCISSQLPNSNKMHPARILPTSVLNALNLIAAEPHLLLTPSVRESLDLVLSMPFAIQRTIRANPQFFENYHKTLNNLIEHYWKDDELLSFLLHLSETIHDHLLFAASTSEKGIDPYDCFSDKKKLIAPEKLQSMAASYLTLESLYTVKQKNQTLFQWISDRMRDKNSNKGALSFLLIEHLRHHSKEIPSKELALIVFASATYMTLATQFQMPQFATFGKEWIEKTFKNRLAKELKEKQSADRFLNHFIQLVTSNASFIGNWSQVQQAPHLFTSPPYTFNVETFTIESTEKIDLLQALIPSAVTHQPDILQLFGNEKIYASVKQGSHKDQYIYSFDYQKHPYQIDYDAGSGKVTIYRKISIKPGREIWAQWMHGHSAVHSPDGDSAIIDRLIADKGIWVHGETRKGWIETHLPREKISGRRIECSLNSKGYISNMRDSSTKMALITGLKKGKTFKEIAPFWPPDQILAFAHQTGNEPSLLYCITTGDSIETAKGSTWQLSAKAFDEKVSLATNIDLDSIEGRFLKTLGHLGSEVAIKVRDPSGDLFVLLQPYAIRRGKTALDTQEIVESELGSPLLLHFDKEGKIKGSPSAFLYLSYLYMQNKDYERSFNYLQRALHEPRISAQEIEHLDWVSSLIHKIPSTSLRKTRFLLKAMLTIHQIRREHFGETLYVDSLSSNYFDEVKQLTEVFEAYQKKMETALAVEISDQIETLTADELDEIETLQRISLKDFSKHYKKKEEVPFWKAKKEEFPSIQIDSVALKNPPIFAIHALAVHADLESEGYKFDQIPHGIHPTTDVLVKYFPAFLKLLRGAERNQVISYLLSKGAWQLSSPKSDQEKTLANMGEYLRQFLLCQSGHNNKNMIQTISQIRNSLPMIPRPKTGPLASLFSLFDLVITRKAPLLNSMVNELRETLRSSLAPTPEPSKLFTVPIVLDQETGKSPSKKTDVTTPKAVGNFIKTDPPGFLPIEKQMISHLLKSEEEAGNDMDKEFTLFAMTEEAQSRGYSLMGMRLLGENLKKIQGVENKLKNDQKHSHTAVADTLSPLFYEALLHPIQSLKIAVAEAEQISEKEQAEVNHQKASLKQKVASSKSYFKEEPNPVEKEENAQIIKGLDQAGEELEKELSRKRVFENNQIETIETNIESALSSAPESLLSRYQTTRAELLTSLRSSDLSLPKELRKMGRFPDLYTDADFIEKGIHLFKSREWETWRTKDPKIQTLLIHFLFLKTTIQQIQRAKKELAAKNYRSAVDLLSTGLDVERYLKNGEYTLSSLHRHCLATEAIDGIVLRPKQREALEKIEQDPKGWRTIRMGIGKTSYIMPIIASILSEKGFLPILTVPNRMLARNRDSIDHSTRRFSDQGALEFTMSLRQDLSETMLSEKYLQLLKTKEAGGYVVTSPDHLACLNEQITLFKRKLSEELLKGDADPKKIYPLQMKIHYLQKIASLIYGESGLTESFFFGDEVDDTHHVSNQINIAVEGEKVPVSFAIRESVEQFFIHLMESKNPGLETLQKALHQGEQAALLDQARKSALRILAEEIRQSPWLQEKLQGDYPRVKNLKSEEWADYLLDETEKHPASLPQVKDSDVTPQFFEIQGGLRTIFSKNAMELLSIQPGNDFGQSNYSGYLVVPKQLKNEVPGMRYSDEYELIFAQYLGYLQLHSAKGTTDATNQFLLQEVNKMKYEAPEAYAHLEEDAKKASPPNAPLSLIEYLETPNAWRHRFELVGRIFDQGYIMRNKLQIELNVQDLYQGAQYGGVSGTPDPYMLPYISDKTLFSEGGESTRSVEAETMLRLSLGHELGLDTVIQADHGIYKSEKAMDYLVQLIEDPETRAIVSASGITTEGKDTIQWVKDIRSYPAGKKRSYLFIHPKEGIPYLWLSGDKTEALPLGTRKIPADCIGLYAPSDTRGTDLPIGKGKVHIFIGPATSLQDVCQAIYRARQLGSTQTAYLHISEQMSVLMTTLKPGTITYGDIFNYIKIRTLQAKRYLNLKAQLQRIKGDLKAKILRYQRSPWREWDKTKTHDLNNKVMIALKQIVQNLIFKEIEPFLVKTKLTNMAASYLPSKKGSAIERVKA